MKYMIIAGILILSITIVLYPSSKPKHNEKYYQTILCDELNGVMEYRLSDRTRVDCLTQEYAIEVDFAKKWAESIGQALYYSQMTSKQPAVALIVADNEYRFVKRLEKVTDKFLIKVFIIEK